MAPSMRASHLKENIAALSTLGPAVEGRVRARLRDSIPLIDRATRMEWLDVAHDVAIVEAVAQEADVAAVRAFSADAIERTIQGPLLRPLVDGALKLFGVTPSSLVRWTPHAYRQIYKDCGDVVHEAHQSSSTVTVFDLPPLLHQSRAWIEGVAGALEGTVRVCRFVPDVTWTRAPDQPTRVVFAVRYADAPAAGSRS